MRSKRALLEQARLRRLTEHHRFLIRKPLAHIQVLDQEIEQWSQGVAERLRPFEAAIERLSTIAGIKRRLAEVILAEIGTDMSRFPSARHLASWAGICPGNHESAGKRKSGRTRKANRWLKATLTQAAWGASRTRRSYFSAQHRRLTTRRGVKRATIAVAHSLLAVSHCLLSRHEMYIDLGVNHFVPDPKRQADQMVRRLQCMGYTVDLKAA